MTFTVACLGPYIVDVLMRPVTEIPAGQGGLLVEEARVTAAGTAGGTAVDLAKLGAEVRALGAIGDDALGRLLRMLLEDHGIDTAGLISRKDGKTSTTVLPIRPNGDRPTFHFPGATLTFAAADLDVEALIDIDVLHVGGPDVLPAFGPQRIEEILREAHSQGAVTTLDLLSRPGPALLSAFDVIWPQIDYFLPNDDQLRGLTGIDDLVEAAQAVRARGVGTVAVTAGGEGSILVSETGVERVPAFAIEVVDTTGCGDAYTAGFIAGLGRGDSMLDAARLGTASAALVAGGLGSDAGIVDLASTLAFMEAAPTRS